MLRFYVDTSALSCVIGSGAHGSHHGCGETLVVWFLESSGVRGELVAVDPDEYRLRTVENNTET